MKKNKPKLTLKIKYIELKKYDNTYLELAYYIWKKDKTIIQLKMHKILYFTYGYYYSLFKEELFKTNFFAWQYGPVDTIIYNSTYKKNKYKLNYLKDDLKNQDKNKNKQAKIFLNQNKKKELDKIINFLINKSSFDLVSDSHKTKPWILTNINNRIENIKINNYFSKKNIWKELWKGEG